LGSGAKAKLIGCPSVTGYRLLWDSAIFEIIRNAPIPLEHYVQNETRKLNSAERDPPVWKSGGEPVLGVPDPNIRFCMEVDWPKKGFVR